MMRLDGKDLSFFRGSFQTDKTTSKFPQTITGDMTIEGIEVVIDMVFKFPTVSHRSLESLSLVILKKLVLSVIAAILSYR